MGRQSEEDFTPRRYEVTHTTTYTYSDDVTGCYERGCLRPRDTPWQRVLSNQITVSPEPDLLSEHVDHFGNTSHYLEITTPHTTLVVSKSSEVEVDWPRVDLDALNQFTVADAAAAVGAEADPVERTRYLLASALVDINSAVTEYANTMLGAATGLGTALAALVHTIFEDFTYAKGATSVKTTLPELLEARRGVCQDFAHLAVGCLRAVGLPACYVSGYLETAPPPGKEKLAGSDASHAWAGVLTPGGQWVHLDPTNDHLADSRYVVTGWGRDFRDVSPLKGVIYTEAKSSELDVAVDVTRLPRADGAVGTLGR